MIKLGLQNRNTTPYTTIVDGKFVRRVPEGTLGAVERINKKGNVVNELIFNGGLYGYLIRAEKKDSEYGLQSEYTFNIGDDGDIIWQVGFASRLNKNFMKMLPNCDLTKPILVNPSRLINDKTGEPYTEIFMTQEPGEKGKSIKHAFTRENPNGMPDMVQVKVKGKETWDDSAQLEFLENKMIEMLATVKPPVQDQTDEKNPLDDLFEEDSEPAF